MKKPKKVVKPWVRVTFTVIESVLIVAICASLVFLGLSFYLDKKSENRMEELRSQVKASRLQLEQIQPDKDKKQSLSMMLLGKEDSGENQDEEAQINAVSGDGIVTALSESKVGKPKEHQDKPILDIYKELHNQNENFAGWLYVDGTQLEYPIMQGPDNKFYLSHGMDRTYDKYGMLIMDVNCTPDIEGGHLIIYGHNVNDGKLFGNLLFFKDSGYIDYHPDISFDTLYEHGNYKVFAVVTTTVTQA